MMFAIEFAHKKGWRNIWLEIDSIVVVKAFFLLLSMCLGKFVPGESIVSTKRLTCHLLQLIFSYRKTVVQTL